MQLTPRGDWLCTYQQVPGACARHPLGQSTIATTMPVLAKLAGTKASCKGHTNHRRLSLCVSLLALPSFVRKVCTRLPH